MVASLSGHRDPTTQEIAETIDFLHTPWLPEPLLFFQEIVVAPAVVLPNIWKSKKEVFDPTTLEARFPYY